MSTGAGNQFSFTKKGIYFAACRDLKNYSLLICKYTFQTASQMCGNLNFVQIYFNRVDSWSVGVRGSRSGKMV